MMEPSEENVNLLASMGFTDFGDIRRALRAAKNDVNQAVAMLTKEMPIPALDDVEMKDVSAETSREAPPPPYDEVVEVQENGMENGVNASNEFPLTNLYELEERVFTEHWSIPYKKDESLGKCLLAATRLADSGLMDMDDNCSRFVNRCLPEAIQKLLTSDAVYRWGPEIQEGIYDMLFLLVDLAATRLKHQPAHHNLLHVLQLALDSSSYYHIKNKSRRLTTLDRTHYEKVFGGTNLAYALSPTMPPALYSSVEPHAWLVNLVNRFGEKGGFELIQERITENPDHQDISDVSALLKPLAGCAEYFNVEKVAAILSPVMDQLTSFLQGIDEKILKNKKTSSLSELMTTLRLIACKLWPDKVDYLDDLRLDIAYRMMKLPHFNARMNGLKEITRLIEEISDHRRSKNAMAQDKLMAWLVDNEVLSVSLEGSIDQVQYCDKIKSIVEFLGVKLSLDELTKIWKLQNGQPTSVVENIHLIVGAAATKFSVPQLDRLFELIQKSWGNESDRVREKLLTLIGQIGREIRLGKTQTRMLELLWDLAHLPILPSHLIQQALAEHLAILNETYSAGEQVKKTYILKCIEDIKKGSWVVPALNQLHEITKEIVKQSVRKQDKGILHDLNKAYDIVKLVTNSLLKSHRQCVATVGSMGHSSYTVIAGRYTHGEHMQAHLRFLAFILEDGMLYLPWSRTKDIWDALVSSPDSSESDKQLCYDWFNKQLGDLESDTQMALFKERLLKLDPSKISMRGFVCFRTYFESVNQNEYRLKKNGNSVYVERLDLIGMDFIWQVIMETLDEDIARIAISLLLSLSYTSLSPKLKKDQVSLHKKFIAECYQRLEGTTFAIGRSALASVVNSATKTLTAPTIPEVASLPSPSRSAKMLVIERLLLLAQEYITMVEDLHSAPRTILSHAATFMGHPLLIYVNCETPKADFTLMAHSNESVASLRQKAADYLKCSQDSIQLVANDRMLLPHKDHKLLYQLEFEDEQLLLVKMAASSTTLRTTDENSFQSYALEQERMLPSIVMASGGQVFDMLYQLADLKERRIRKQVRSLLMLIPTDQTIQDALDARCRDNVGDDRCSMSSEDSSSSSESSKLTLEGLFRPTAPSMSAFRVLYNLEVLSSKLLPVVEETTAATKSFCEGFLHHGGLNLVVNVLKKDVIPAETDLATRQDLYSLCLQLARLLLCGQSWIGPAPLSQSTEVTMDTGAHNTSRSPSKRLSTGSPANGISGTNGIDPDSLNTPSAAKMAIQTMSKQDFVATISCFIKLAWAAAAGKLSLATSQHSSASTGTIRSRQNSSGSTASSDGGEGGEALHPGVCIQQKAVSSKDTHIAKEAMEILVRCLQLRTDLLDSFYDLKFTKDFIIDVLLGSVHAEVRNAALEEFDNLCRGTSGMEDPSIQHPKHFVLHVLLKAPVPLWSTSTSLRGNNQRYLSQCWQYFDLRCRLLNNLSTEEQKLLQVTAISMLKDEINWLMNFDPAEDESGDTSLQDGVLTGHLKLTRTLFTCQGINKEKLGKEVIETIMDDFLFPAAKLIVTKQGKPSSATDFRPKCFSREARVAAYELLVTLCEGSLDNFDHVSKQLILMHHQPPDASTLKQWEYLPPVDGRPINGFVGLRNAGATCYMNSVIQQLYMIPGLPEDLMGLDVSGGSPESLEDNVYYQMQQVFGHLMESKLQYHVPERFWKCFKLWGQTINVREQQDAFEFFTDLTDQLDEFLKSKGHKKLFQPRFEGIFSDQKICKDCPHRYEREESFCALNLTVKGQNLESSLEQFVRGEMLEGDNAYYCEECNHKRTAIKRLCIKRLPPVLVIQLKRFGYDWEANRALKFDDYFKFPWILDMEPYTAQGVSRREKKPDENRNELPDDSSGSFSADDTLYQLVGVVVHSGQANAGHYYSFIKDRRATSLTNINKGHWFKFNDTVVEELEMTDYSLEAECFGGSYKAKVYDQSNSFPENRQRYWNGYILFYEKLEGSRTPREPLNKRFASAKLSHMPSRIEQPRAADSRDGSSPEVSPRYDSDGLTLLTALLHKGEKRGLFVDKMPGAILQNVHDENVEFMKNRDYYNQDYFTFIRNLTFCNIPYCTDKRHEYSNLCMASMQMAAHFLFNTYFRTKRTLRNDIGDWCSGVEAIAKSSKLATRWFLAFLTDNQHRHAYIRPLLLECPTREVRMAFSQLLEQVLESYLDLHGGRVADPHVDSLLKFLLGLLENVVGENCRHCKQYFLFLSRYLLLGSEHVLHLFAHQAFLAISSFLLGHNTIEQVLQATDPPAPSIAALTENRRWGSVQGRDFTHLHHILANLILHCDLSGERTVEPAGFTFDLPEYISLEPNQLLRLDPDIKRVAFNPHYTGYIREVVVACHEVTGALRPMMDMLRYCCFCNQTFSGNLLMHIKNQLASIPVADLKSPFNLLTNLLLLEDPLQGFRLKVLFEGASNTDKDAGLLGIIEQSMSGDSRRAYQFIKFLVVVAGKSPVAKDYLVAISTKWNTAVIWLKKKMSDSSYSGGGGGGGGGDGCSNESFSAANKSFMRTMSAQDTLDEATALLTEIESHHQSRNSAVPTLIQGKDAAEDEEEEEEEEEDEETSDMNQGSPLAKVTSFTEN